MHITKLTSNQLIVKRYPKFCWTAIGFLGIGGVVILMSSLFGLSAEDSPQTALWMIGIAGIVLMFAELRIYEFDRDRQQLRIRRCWVLRERTVDYPLDSVVAVRLSSMSVSAAGYSGSGSRIELVYPQSIIKPLTSSYSSDATQRQVAIAIAEWLNVEALVPPTLGDAFQAASRWLMNQVMGRSSKHR